jgi:hypothetical protein
MVFPDIQRMYLDGAGYSEPIYPFLNRSSRKSVTRVRELIENWFAQFPIGEQTELLPRLNSSDDQELISAFFELYSHQLLLHFGYKPIIHPIINPNVTKKPDFLVTGNNEEFILEAAITNEKTGCEQKGEVFLHQAFEKIDEIQSKDFFANIEIEGIPLSPIPGRKMKRDIHAWLDSLDYEENKRIYYSEDGYKKVPKKIFKYNGVMLTVSATPKKLNREKPEGLIGSWMTGVRLMNTKQAIRRTIEKKGYRYGKFESPYFIAIDVLSMSCNDNDVIQALFGSEQFIYNVDDIKAPLIPSRAKDGVWSRNKGTRMSGVLIIKDLTPWTVAHQNLTLFLNPWAKIPYHGSLLQLPHTEVNKEGQICFIEGKDTRSILGLPENWPENV